MLQKVSALVPPAEVVRPQHINRVHRHSLSAVRHGRHAELVPHNLLLVLHLQTNDRHDRGGERLCEAEEFLREVDGETPPWPEEA